MFYLRYTLGLLSLSLFSFSWIKDLPNPKLTNGVSRELAIYRKSVLSHLNYKLEFDIPMDKQKGIEANGLISFQLSANKHPLQLDFREGTENIKSVSVNGVKTEVFHREEHIVIDPKYLQKGKNVVEIRFTAGNGALNRNADYLYALFVPDRARTVFPCFDQPDLKATYELTLKIPADWKALTNAKLKDSLLSGQRKTYVFDRSDTLSTYLFSFVAGKFKNANGKVGGMNSAFLYRETDTVKIKNSVDEIFKAHSQSLDYFEKWTGIAYPFQKFGFVAIPDFQFGGMEHPGTIHYKASTFFLDGAATKDQVNSRSHLIAHETAHMWFGDLVTMNWFTDVWMKEVFANFMADKSAEGIEGSDVFDLKFLIDHFPAAYGIDRTTGANPIRQSLDNLKDAGTLYGNIIYHKSPIMMRQLERLMGKEKFQSGVRDYLKKFSNGNASWPDLIQILDDYADADLKSWNKVWVDEPGRPVISYNLEDNNGRITKFDISQKAEYGKARNWPQLVEVKLVYATHTQEVTVALNQAKVAVERFVGEEVPLFVLFNSTGQGYGLWPVDKKMFSRVYDLPSALNRATAYISLYENMLVGRSVKPRALLEIFREGLLKEKDELNLKLISNYLSNIYWEFISSKERTELSAALETVIWNALEQQSAPNNKKLLFKAYQDIFLTQSAKDRLYVIWNTQQAPIGVKINEDDYTSLAFSLALRETQNEEILKRQLSRITNIDRIKRFEFIMPAISSDVKQRDQFFKSLELKSNRAKESNVGAALYYLNHPLRQPDSEKYLRKSLELLEEIQSTGDIFFPQNWLQSIFTLYQSPTAAKIVKDFIKERPGYNPKLKAKILQTADNLFKAESLVKSAKD